MFFELRFIIIPWKDNWEIPRHKCGASQVLDFQLVHRLDVNTGFSHNFVYWTAPKKFQVRVARILVLSGCDACSIHKLERTQRYASQYQMKCAAVATLCFLRGPFIEPHRTAQTWRTFGDICGSVRVLRTAITAFLLRTQSPLSWLGWNFSRFATICCFLKATLFPVLILWLEARKYDTEHPKTPPTKGNSSPQPQIHF